MDCETASPLIEALCDDELDVATAARLLAHLDACEPCSALRRDAETRNAALREARPAACKWREAATAPSQAAQTR